MLQRIRVISMVAVLVVGLVAISGSVYAEGPPEEGYFGYAPLSEGEISGDATDGREAAPQRFWPCDYETKGDNPHRSRTGFAASAHGWWLDHSNGDCPEYADVEVTLLAKMCYYNPDPQYCFWDIVDHKELRIREGGGAGRRTTARHDCTSTNEVAYYSMVDVDLVGTWDGPYKWFSPVVEVPCCPAPKT